MTTSTSSSKAARWSRGEKALLWGSIAALAVGIGWSLWLNYVNGDPVVHLPTPSTPIPNGYDYLVSAGNNIALGWPMSGSRPPSANSRAKRPPRVQHPDLGDPKIMAAAEQLLGQNRSALATAEQGLQYTCLAPPPQSKAGLNFSAYLNGIHNVARVADFQAEVDGKRGDFDSAVRYALLAIHIGAETPRGGKTIFSVVGWDCEGAGREVLWTNVDALNPEQCRRAASAIAAVDGSRFTYADALQENKWGGEAEFLQAFRAPNWKSQFSSPNNDLSFSDRMKLSMIGKRLILDDYDAQMDALIFAAKAPYGTKVAPAPTDPISAGSVGVEVGRDKTADYAQNEAEDRLLMTACALRAYKLDRGAYPSTLQALVPTYLPSVPVDPFTSSSTLRYKTAAGKAYVLYSVGPDQHDDGGKPLLGSGTDPKGDIVAEINL